MIIKLFLFDAVCKLACEILITLIVVKRLLSYYILYLNLQLLS